MTGGLKVHEDVVMISFRHPWDLQIQYKQSCWLCFYYTEVTVKGTPMDLRVSHPAKEKNPRQLDKTHGVRRLEIVGEIAGKKRQKSWRMRKLACSSPSSYQVPTNIHGKPTVALQ